MAYAKALENLKEYKTAAQALEKAIELDNRPQILRLLGSIYLKTGETEKAQEIKAKLDKVKANRKVIRQNRLNQSSIKKI